MKKLMLALPVLALGCGGNGGSSVDGGSDASVPRYDGPMVREVAVSVITSGIRRSALAFGGDGPVTSAVASENVISILLNLPLLANGLIEIPCADGSFDRIPAGATSEDIARCSPPDLADCSAVCQGPPVVGILDVNGDGEPDGSRLLDYGGGEAGVRIQCDGVNIRINRFFENYNPNGPRQLGVLGPMLSLDVPTLRTSSECAITFRDEVTGIDGARVCAPEGGDITLDCAVPGAPITFGTEPLRLIDNDPEEGQTVVGLTDPDSTSKNLYLLFNAVIDAGVASAFTLTENGVEREISVDIPQQPGASTTIVIPGGLVAGAAYALTMDTSLTDLYGGPLPDSLAINFATAE